LQVIIFRLADQETIGFGSGRSLQDNLQDGGKGQRKDQARQAEQQASQQQGNNGHQGIDANLSSHDIGRDEIPLQELHYLEPADHSHGIPATVLGSQREQRRQQRSDRNADVWDEQQEGGQGSEEPGVLDPQDPKSGSIQHGYNCHHRNQSQQVVLYHPVDLV